ncbi:MAG: DUF1902 domain-containing protein [Myxococcota bacterium]
MEQILRLHIEKLPEGVYLATSKDVQGLVAQGRTVAETIDIARDVARKILETRREHDDCPRLRTVGDVWDGPVVIGA